MTETTLCSSNLFSCSFSLSTQQVIPPSLLRVKSGLAGWLVQANETSAEVKGPHPEEAKKSPCRILQSSSSGIPDVKPRVGLAEPEMEAAGNAVLPREGELPCRVTWPINDLQVTSAAPSPSWFKHSTGCFSHCKWSERIEMGTDPLHL